MARTGLVPGYFFDPRTRLRHNPVTTRNLAILLAALFGVVAARSAMLIGREMTAVSTDRLVDIQSRAIERGDPAAAGMAPRYDPADLFDNPRAVLADAHYAALQAQALPPGPARQALLERAIAGSTRAAAARPHWGEATTVLAYAVSLRDGEDAPATYAAFRQSYVAAPYLRHFGAWRVRYGLAHWEQLDAATRSRLIDEAVWLSRMDEPTRAIVFSLARQSQAYPRFMLRWLATRVGDVDFRAVERPAP